MSMLRFLPGILAVQVATALLVVAGTGSSPDWPPLAALAAIITLLAGLWFGSIAEHLKKDALTRAAASFAREREHLVVRAETDKRAALEETHRRLVLETRRAQRKAHLVLGLGLLGLLTVGGVLLAVEFMTVGLLFLTAAGGALGGYLARVRQEALAARSGAALPAPPPSRPALPGQRGRND